MNNTTPLNRNDLDRFNAACKAILNTKGEIPLSLRNEFLASYGGRASELIKFYAQAETQETKNYFAGWIGSFCKKKGLIALVDNLYSQQIIDDGGIRTLLKKYPLFADVCLEPAECDAIISVMLDFLDTPCPEIDSLDDEIKFEVDQDNRTSAARILVVLAGYSNTSSKSRARIQSKGDLIVRYVLADASFQNGFYLPKTLNDYLADRID